MATRETIPGTRAFGAALAAGETRFIAAIAERAGVSLADADLIFSQLRKLKCVRRKRTDWNVTHGALMDAPVLLRALELAKGGK